MLSSEYFVRKSCCEVVNEHCRVSKMSRRRGADRDEDFSGLESSSFASDRGERSDGEVGSVSLPTVWSVDPLAELTDDDDRTGDMG